MVELQQVKDYLWLDEDNVKLQLILDRVNQELENYIWDYSLWEKSVTLKYIKNNTYWLNHINATELIEINWITDLDYQINYDWTIQVLQHISPNDFWTWEVKYKAWFSETPADIIWAVSQYCGALYAKDLWKDVVAENLWPRWVTYDANKNYQKEFKTLLNKYIPLHLRIW